MRYWKVLWIDADGFECLSDPISTWTDAELYRRELNNPTARLLSF